MSNGVVPFDGASAPWFVEGRHIRRLSRKGAPVRKLILLCLALILPLSSKAALAVPYCDCEVCAADLDQTCFDYWADLYRPCATYYGIYCR